MQVQRITVEVYVFRCNDLYRYVSKYSVVINILACTVAVSKSCLLLLERCFDFSG